MDARLRDLERRARAGDEEALEILDRERARAGLGWFGEELPPRARRGPESPFYETDIHPWVWYLGRDGGTPIPLVRPPESLDTSTGLEFEDALYEASRLAPKGTPCLVDLSGVRKFGSAALGVLLRASHSFPVMVVSPNRTLRGMIEVLQLRKEFSVARSFEHALETIPRG